MKTDKSCQLAVLPHNLLTASLSSKREGGGGFQFQDFASDIRGLSNPGGGGGVFSFFFLAAENKQLARPSC